jgi:hypothetical protein
LLLREVAVDNFFIKINNKGISYIDQRNNIRKVFIPIDSSGNSIFVLLTNNKRVLGLKVQLASATT